MNAQSWIFAVQFATAFICSSALAQPSPTPTGQTDYGLFFTTGASRLFTGDSGTHPLNLGPKQNFTASNNCKVTYQEDGDITCYVDSSCPDDAEIIPLCVFSFSGPEGITVDDVAVLMPLTASNVTSGSSSLMDVPDRSPDALYEAFKKH